MFVFGASMFSRSLTILGLVLVAGGLRPGEASGQISKVDPVLSEFDLTQAQKERLARLLPHSYPKLQKRLPFHVVVLGDAVAGMEGYGPDGGDIEKGYPARFLDQLGAQFYYSGGVRVVKAASNKSPKAMLPSGPVITLRSLAGRGGLAVDGLARWAALGANPLPDLVIVGYGSGEAASGADAGAFAANLKALVKTVRATGADVLLVGPTLTANEPEEASLAATRVYAAEVKALAEAEKVAFCDLGDLSGLARLEPLPGEPALPPEEIYAAFVAAYKNHFRWSDVEDFSLPQPSLHERLGRLMFRHLLDGDVASAWSIRGAQVSFKSPTAFTLEFSLRNETDVPLRLVVLPLVPPGWVPQDATPDLTLKAGKAKKLEVAYVSSGHGVGIPSSVGDFCLPLFVSDGKVARAEAVIAQAQPLSLTWNPATQYGVEGSFRAAQSVTNRTPVPIKGTAWTATWGGETKSGRVDLPPGVPTELPVNFDLKGDGDFPRRTDVMKLSVAVNGLSMNWERRVQIVRNIGLKQAIPLLPAAGGKEASPPVTVRFEADSTALYVTADIGGLALEDDQAGTALVAELGLDARRFGVRLGPGAIAPTSYRLGVADGFGETSKIAPWAFGSGYAAAYDPGAMPIRLQSGAAGSHRILWVVPRSYLYLHDFTPGNGNSHLGISLGLSFYRQALNGGAGGGFPAEMRYSLAQNGRNPVDAESLVVLELSQKPTQRWTVINW